MERVKYLLREINKTYILQNRHMKLIISIILGCFIQSFAALGQNKLEYYIASNGQSSNPGTKNKPFATFEDARNALRTYKNLHHGSLGNSGASVWIREGIYCLSESFKLDKKDSGTENARITYQAFPGEKVSVTGAIKISPMDVKPLSDVRIAERIIDAEARGKIMEIDLRSLNINDFGDWKISGFGRPYVSAGMELFINGKPFTLARFPNKGKIRIRPEDIVDAGTQNELVRPGKIRFPSDRIKFWSNDGNMIACGSFCYAWATDQLRIGKIDKEKKEISFSDSHLYEISGKQEWNQYYIFNLLEEIDDPGEFYVDKNAGKLYFYPYINLAPTDTILISVLNDPLVSLSEASNISFKNICFEATREMGFSIEDGNNNVVENCTLRNMGMVAARVGRGFAPNTSGDFYFDSKGGKNNGFINCTVENTGCGGICLGGGNRKTLESAGNFVSGCEFSNCGRITYAYKCPVNIYGVGNRISYCRFNECQATAIYLQGNNHIIENNNISQSCKFIDDQGAFYMGRNPSEFGNIIRFNYFNNIGHFGNTIAVYLDDGACGTQVYGNVFYKAGTMTIDVGGGSYNTVSDNIFIESPLAIHVDNRLELTHWMNEYVLPGNLFEEKLKEVDYRKPPYSVQYPGLVTYFDHPGLPQHNDMARNIFINIKQILDGQKKWGPFHDDNITLNRDAAITDIHDFRFNKAEITLIEKVIPDFKTIDFEKITNKKGK